LAVLDIPFQQFGTQHQLDTSAEATLFDDFLPNVKCPEVIGKILNSNIDQFRRTTDEILSIVVDDGRKSAAYPWCFEPIKFEQPEEYATCRKIRHPRRF
jgi:hypothetical protein